MKFLVDANLPPGLAVWLREYAHEAIHTRNRRNRHNGRSYAIDATDAPTQ